MKRYLILSTVLVVLACSDENNKGSKTVEVSATVKDCEIWFVEPTSTGNQKRMRVFAGSASQIGLERAATAAHLALKAIELTGYDFVDVFLIPENVKKDRNELDSSVATAWVRYAPVPDKIPFMKQEWEIKYKTGGTTKVVSEYGHKEYQFEDFIELGEMMTLNVVDNACDASKISYELK